jgi:very-short-patch-repair endonuclease
MFASHRKSKFWSKKNTVKPEKVTYGSQKKFWFDCDVCPHDFEAMLRNVSAGTWCPYCSNKKLCENDDCDMCFNQSFASHEKVIYWNYKMNEPITPRQVFKSSNKKFWFNCNVCYHTFPISPARITVGNWCSYCSNNILCENKNCDICFNKSFASHVKAEFWNYEMNEPITPRQVFKSTGQKFWFNCNVCYHTFPISPARITVGNWCSYCSNNILCENKNCDICFNKSFASHVKAEFWNYEMNKPLVPRQVFKNSHVEYIFNCPDCSNKYITSLGRVSAGSWCSCTKNKTEIKLFSALKPYYPCLETCYRTQWCKNKKCLPFDFVLKNECIIIELDGLQHFQQVWKWEPPKLIRKIDIYKMQCANENRFSVIRILQEDVWYDRYDWLTALKTSIEDIITINKIRHNEIYIANMFLHRKNQYDQHIQDINLNNDFKLTHFL